MTIRLSRFAHVALAPALISAACSAALAQSGQPLGVASGSIKPDGASVCGDSVDNGATSGASFAKMFGDLARQSEAPPETAPDSTINPKVADSPADLPAADGSANQTLTQASEPAAAENAKDARPPSPSVATPPTPLAPFSNNAKARVFAAQSKHHSSASATPGQAIGNAASPEQSAPPPPFTRPPSPTLADSAGGNQYLRQAASVTPNLQMTDAKIVRGSQPSGQTLSLLKSGGVTTIINLRNEDVLVAQEGSLAKRLGLNYVNVPMNIFDVPSNEQIKEFLSAIGKASGKVYVHCQHGQDRTGTMIAIYRIAHDGWDANRAYQEMLSCGFRPYLGNLTAGVYNFSAAQGRPEPRPAVALSDMFSSIKADLFSGGMQSNMLFGGNSFHLR